MMIQGGIWRTRGSGGDEVEVAADAGGVGGRLERGVGRCRLGEVREGSVGEAKRCRVRRRAAIGPSSWVMSAPLGIGATRSSLESVALLTALRAT